MRNTYRSIFRSSGASSSVRRTVALLLIALLLFTCCNTSSYAASKYTTYNQVYKKVYNTFLNHKNNVTFTYSTSSKSSAKKLFNNFKSKFFNDDGEDFDQLGDYMRFSLYRGSSINCTQRYVGESRNLTFNCTIKYKTTAAQEKAFDASLESTLNSLDLSDKSDYQKINTIYSYICKNVKYDYSDSGITKYTAYAALVRNKAVCQGYACLFYRMCKASDIPVRIITGKSKGQGHAWNIVKLNGKWYNVDSTWDAMTDSRVFFLKSNKDFQDHKRNAEYSTKKFNENHIMTTTSYYR